MWHMIIKLYLSSLLWNYTRYIGMWACFVRKLIGGMVISKCRYIKWSNNRCNIHKLIHKNGFFFKVGRNIQHSYHVLLYCTYIYFCFFFLKTHLYLFISLCVHRLCYLCITIYFFLCVFLENCISLYYVYPLCRLQTCIFPCGKT